MPVWMPWIVRPVLSQIGVEYESYERVGYGRFALKDVSFSEGGTEVSAEKVEGFIPTAWLVALLTGGEDEEFILVEKWRVEVAEKEEEGLEKPKREEKEVSVYEIVGQVEAIVSQVKKWLPRARLAEGELVVAGRSIGIPEAIWREGLISGVVNDLELQERVQLQADLRDGLPYSIEAKVDPFPLLATFSIARVEREIAVGGTIDFAGNEVLVDVAFPETGFLLSRGHLEAENFRLPRQIYEIDGYPEIFGNVVADWRDGAFEVRLDVKAEPELSGEESEQLPPLAIEAEARGDLVAVEVRKLFVESPWLSASLSEPLAIDYRGELLNDGSVFNVVADLSKQPFAEIEGELSGNVRVYPGENRFPSADFDLFVRRFSGYEVELEEISLGGSFGWPELALEQLSVLAVDGSHLSGNVHADLEAQEILQAKLDGELLPEMVRAWLPEGIDFEAVEFEVEAEGPFVELVHSGRIDFTGLIVPEVRELGGVFDWKGEMENLSDFSLEVSSGEGFVKIRGASALAIEEKNAELFLEEVRLERSGELLVGSVAESRIGVDWRGDAGVKVTVDQLDWRGEETEVQLAGEVLWPIRGNLGMKLRGISADLVSDFAEFEFDSVTVPSLKFDGSWDEGPLEFELVGDLRISFGEGEEISVEAEIAGKEEEVRVVRLRAAAEENVLAFAEGVLPVLIEPGGERMIEIREEGRLDFRAETSPEAPFWRRIEEWTGIDLAEPNLGLEISGTPSRPVGEIRASSPRIVLKQPEGLDEPLPEITDLELSLVFDESHFSLDRFAFRVEGQVLTAEAQLPMEGGDWEKLLRGEGMPDLAKASARLLIPDAKVAPFSRFAPEILSPEGDLRADIELKPGGFLDGSVVLENIATRPLPPFGSLRDGTARLALEGRSVKVEEISALIGGERLTITGEMDVPIDQPFAFNFNILGTNLPLARQTGMVIRGDLDLNVAQEAGAVPVISGNVDLRDSFYFAHIRIMPSGALATPSRRPPFFSVGVEPFDDWQLDVRLRGPNFLEVRGPIFQGLISADFNLIGTLEEPQAIGAALIERGRVRFPFAGITIDQGEIALRPENPFLPQLFIIGSGMAFGYDLTMEISGTAEEPTIEFSANPPLTSEQVLLMISTGDLPRDEIQFTTQQRASKFAIYFGQNLLYEITGDDRSEERRVGKEGSEVSEQGRETMVIEYRLTKSWSAVGEYDRFDEYNAGVKWNIYSR